MERSQTLTERSCNRSETVNGHERLGTFEPGRSNVEERIVETSTNSGNVIFTAEAPFIKNFNKISTIFNYSTNFHMSLVTTLKIIGIFIKIQFFSFLQMGIF
jgi:hypothetical protein